MATDQMRKLNGRSNNKIQMQHIAYPNCAESLEEKTRERNREREVTFFFLRLHIEWHFKAKMQKEQQEPIKLHILCRILN